MFWEGCLKKPMLGAVLTDAHLWVPVCVLVVGILILAGMK